MSIADVAAAPLSDIDHRMQLRRAVIASTVGTTIEWYDVLVYGQMAALVFAKLYFPSSNPLTGTLEAFATLLLTGLSMCRRATPAIPCRTPRPMTTRRSTASA
jgi:hypothetical protein